MIELRCRSLELALALGAHVPGTRNYAEKLVREDSFFRVYYSESTPPLYWRWQLDDLSALSLAGARSEAHDGWTEDEDRILPRAAI
jgi:hypothetical protein